jgi:cobalt/nickel transport system permease protein
MHIAEGILTGRSVVETSLAGAAVVAWGSVRMAQFVKAQPERKPLLGMAGAFVFLVSLVPIPAFNGTCSHPCGTPLAGILLGPGIAAALSFLTLLLQALFFAHGGFSSLGANVLTLGLFGAGFGWLTYRLGRVLGLPVWAAAGLGGLIGDWMTYALSGGILAFHLAFRSPHPQHSFTDYLKVIFAAYLPVQGPISIGEMIFTGVVLYSIGRQRPEVLEQLKVVPPAAKKAVVAGLLVFLGLASVGAWAVSQPQGLTASPKVTEFKGMDESVNMSLAAQAGAPASNPFINLEARGDVWNFVLLLGGGIAGFIIGKNWAHLFEKKA